MNGKIGHYAFVIGVLIAVLTGLMPQIPASVIIWVLIALGLVVGLLNVTAKETHDFLVASIALMIGAGLATTIIPFGVVLSTMLANIVAFVFPAALVVAIKTIWSLAQD